MLARMLKGRDADPGSLFFAAARDPNFQHDVLKDGRSAMPGWRSALLWKWPSESRLLLLVAEQGTRHAPMVCFTGEGLSEGTTHRALKDFANALIERAFFNVAKHTE